MPLLTLLDELGGEEVFAGLPVVSVIGTDAARPLDRKLPFESLTAHTDGGVLVKCHW